MSVEICLKVYQRIYKLQCVCWTSDNSWMTSSDWFNFSLRSLSLSSLVASCRFDHNQSKEFQKGEDSKYQICELKHFRRFWPQVSPSNSRKIMHHIGGCRNKFSILVQTISGADYLNKHSHKLGETESPMCNQCNEENFESSWKPYF